MEKEALAEKAIPNCNIHFIDGEEMKKALMQYYQILFDSNSKSVGGALPEEDIEGFVIFSYRPSIPCCLVPPSWLWDFPGKAELLQN